MGEAKRRRAEIERLKAMSPEEAAAWHREREDDSLIQRGINPAAAITDPSGILAMTRRLHSHLEGAKSEQNIDSAIKFLYQKVDATIRDLGDIPVACHQGCSHCCVIWVAVSAPEALYVSKQVAAMGADAVERVRTANEVTKQFEFEVRDQHPHDCPLLQNNNCTIYENRPTACRQASSIDAQVCARSYRNLTNEGIPTPALYIGSRSVYATALYAALARSGLHSESYELNAAVTRALDTPDAERRWLAGENIFAGVLQEVTPPEFTEHLNLISRLAFGE